MVRDIAEEMAKPQRLSHEDLAGRVGLGWYLKDRRDRHSRKDISTWLPDFPEVITRHYCHPHALPELAF